MRYKLIKILITGFSLLPMFVAGQDKKTNEEIFRPLLKEIRLPRDLSNCRLLFSSVVIPIRNNKIGDNLTYSKDCPESLKKEIKRSLRVLDIKSLTRDYFGISSGISYKILLPIVIYPGEYCQDSIKSEEFRSRISDGFDIDVKGPVYLMDALFIGTNKPIQKEEGVK